MKLRKRYIASLIAAAVFAVYLTSHFGCGNVTGGGGGGGSTGTPWIYCGNSQDKTISYIDGSTNTVMGSIELGSYVPYHMVASIDGKKMYVSTLSNDILIIDTVSNEISGLITTDASTNSFGMAVSKDGIFLYVPRNNSSSLIKIPLGDPTTYEVLASVTPGSPTAIVISNDGTKAYVGDSTCNISIVDTSSMSIISTEAIGASGFIRGMTMKKNYLVVPIANGASGECFILDPSVSPGHVAWHILGPGNYFMDVIAIPGKDKLYVSNWVNNGKINIIDWSGTDPTFESNVITGESYTLYYPAYMAVTANGRYVYVDDVMVFQDKLIVVDTSTDKVVAEIMKGRGINYNNNPVVIYK